MPSNHTETLTVHLWDHIEAHPRLTADELVDAMVAAGHIPAASRRMYAASLNGRSPAQRSAGLHGPASVDEDKAARFVVVRALGKMRSWGSIARDDEQRYVIARPLRRTGVGALVTPAHVTHTHAALLSVRRQTELFLAKHPDGKGFMPIALANALRSYLEASRAEYEAQQKIKEA